MPRLWSEVGSVICHACGLAGTYNSIGLVDDATLKHTECDGKCDCQHKMGEHHVVRG